MGFESNTDHLSRKDFEELVYILNHSYGINPQEDDPIFIHIDTLINRKIIEENKTSYNNAIEDVRYDMNTLLTKLIEFE